MHDFRDNGHTDRLRYKRITVDKRKGRTEQAGGLLVVWAGVSVLFVFFKIKLKELLPLTA